MNSSPSEHSPSETPRAGQPAAPEAAPSYVSHRHSRTPGLHRLADGVSEALIYAMVIFTPWAFGTTERWSIWTMNIAGYFLGALLLTKWLVRWQGNYQPDRWDAPAPDDQTGAPGRVLPLADWCTRGMAVLTVVLLLYCLASALNARATFLIDEGRFEYHQSLAWLPHSYDAPRTWFFFWEYLGLACFFWALRDWLLTKTRRERHRRSGREAFFPETRGPLTPALSPAGDQGVRSAETEALHGLRSRGRESAPPFPGDPAPTDVGGYERSRPSLGPRRASAGEPPQPEDAPRLPTRLRRLLWILCLNGALLALEGILQRLDGTNKLLWLVEPRLNKTADAQFGPYAYRSNAAQYLNLIWPVCLGFWWTLRKHRRSVRGSTVRIGSGPELLLIPCAVLMAASPIISTSRGGAAIAAANTLGAWVVLSTAGRRGQWLTRLVIGLVVVAALGLGGYLGWPKLKARLTPPVTTVPTHYGPVQTNDLTLHCLLAAPREPPARSRVLVGLSEQPAPFDAPGTVFQFLSTDGSLHCFMYGDRYTNTLRVVVPGFTTNHGGRPVAVTMVKTTNVLVYVDGQPVATREYARGQPPPSWSDPIGTAFFWLFKEPALAGAFYNYALGPDEIRALAEKGIPDPTPPEAASGHASHFAEGLDGFSAESAGTRTTGDVDGIAGQDNWLKLERAAGVGPLQAQRVNADCSLNPGQRARVNFTVSNPNSVDYAVSAGWSGAFAPPVIIPAGTEQDVALVCTNSTTEASTDFRIAVTTIEGALREDVPAGQALYLRGISLDPFRLVAEVDTRKRQWARLLQEGLSGRTEIRTNALRIAREFPWFGSGPGTFGAVYQLYRSDEHQVWHAYLHDDWFEARITLGRVGFTLALLLLVLAPLRWLTGSGIRAAPVLVGLIALGLAGCLVHARFDFPFQIYSVLLLFLTLCGIWMAIGRKS